MAKPGEIQLEYLALTLLHRVRPTTSDAGLEVEN